jgi:FlaA1/EpsC-like NDP-sugar epimerase
MFSPAFGCAADRSVTSARFANVAFSDGSLLFGWTRRLAKGQPLAAPRNTRRYFISAEEAGQICVLAAVVGVHGVTYVPKLDPSADLKDLADVARAFLETHGLRAQEYEDEALATAQVEEDLANRRYPLLLTPRDTSGEKPYEEFLGSGERMIDVGMERLCAVKGRVAPEGTLRRAISEFEDAVGHPSVTVTKDSLVRVLSEVVDDLRHLDTGKSLDDRL